jgi:branched-chain amino acid aminotransferase
MSSQGRWIQFNSHKVVEIDTGSQSLDQYNSKIPSGVYTTFRTYQANKVMAIASHFNRLEESASLLNKPLHIDQDLVRSVLTDLFQANSGDTRVRIVVDLTVNEGDIYIFQEKLQTLPLEAYTNGLKAITRTMQRENPQAKTTNFISTARLYRNGLDQDVNEVLMLDEQNHFLEGLSSNFFAVIDNQIYTAPYGVLSGLTRDILLQLANDLNLKVRFEFVSYDQIKQFQETFITSASRAVLPIVKIDEHDIGAGQPGPFSVQLYKAYQAYISSKLETI